MQRYLQYDDLKKQGLEHFDNWASTFGETTTAIEVAKLNILKQSFMSQKYELQDKITKAYPQQIAKLDEKIEAMEYDIVSLQNQLNNNSDNFSPMILNCITYTEKENAGKKLLECCQSIKSFEETPIGEYKGFKMSLYDEVEENSKDKVVEKEFER